MRPLDESPLDPEIPASLEAIDATLAGEPVAPEYAGFAELALLLTDDRPAPSAEFARELDERVAARFAPVRPAAGGRRRVPRWWLWTPAAGLAATLVVAIVIVLGGSHRTIKAFAGSSAPPKAGAIGPTHKAAAASSAAPAATASPAPANATVAQPPPNGRRIIQGAQLSLSTSPTRIDAVAQEVFVVVGQVKGIVNSSTVTATGGPGGYAQFALSIPSGSMPQAMAALSGLRYARVASRTDTTQDVNGQYRSDVSKLADDRAVRASLLKQLAAATTQGQIDSLRIRIRDIDAVISSDQATLHSLNNQINYSQVAVTINGGTTPVPVRSGSGSGFNLAQAAHDAGRVLTIAAGVALIGLAALAPIALLVALGWWIAAAIRRRRREHALDLV